MHGIEESNVLLYNSTLLRNMAQYPILNNFKSN